MVKDASVCFYNACVAIFMHNIFLSMISYECFVAGCAFLVFSNMMKNKKRKLIFKEYGE